MNPGSIPGRLAAKIDFDGPAPADPFRAVVGGCWTWLAVLELGKLTASGATSSRTRTRPFEWTGWGAWAASAGYARLLADASTGAGGALGRAVARKPRSRVRIGSMPTPTPEQVDLLKRLAPVAAAYNRSKAKTAALSDQRLALWVEGRALGVKIVDMAAVSKVGSGDVHDGFRKLLRHELQARQNGHTQLEDA